MAYDRIELRTVEGIDRLVQGMKQRKADSCARVHVVVLQLFDTVGKYMALARY